MTIALLVFYIKFFLIYQNVKTFVSQILSKKILKGFKKRLVKGIKICLKRRKARSENIVVSDIKVLLNMKNKG